MKRTFVYDTNKSNSTLKRLCCVNHHHHHNNKSDNDIYSRIYYHPVAYYTLFRVNAQVKELLRHASFSITKSVTTTRTPTANIVKSTL